jgi:hypothetical protein
MMALVGVLKTTNVFPGRSIACSSARAAIRAARRADHLVHRRALGRPRQCHHGDLRLPHGVGDGAAAAHQRSAFLLPMVMAANIGGTATLIGDPPNVLIGADPRTGLASWISSTTSPCPALLMMVAGVVRAPLLSRRHRPAADADHAGAATPTGAGSRTCRCCAPPAGSPR